MWAVALLLAVYLGLAVALLASLELELLVAGLQLPHHNPTISLMAPSMASHIVQAWMHVPPEASYVAGSLVL